MLVCRLGQRRADPSSAARRVDGDRENPAVRLGAPPIASGGRPAEKLAVRFPGNERQLGPAGAPAIQCRMPFLGDDVLRPGTLAHRGRARGVVERAYRSIAPP
jgi:hypothetical protein